MDDTGFDKVPRRYIGPAGQEVIDIIRNRLGDAGFLAFCEGTALKYELRAGKKAGTNDHEKELWYLMMAAHVRDPDNHPDPRVYRVTE